MAAANKLYQIGDGKTKYTCTYTHTHTHTHKQKERERERKSNIQKIPLFPSLRPLKPLEKGVRDR
jgi:hypothetical protein